jgi:hypothetical protein
MDHTHYLLTILDTIFNYCCDNISFRLFPIPSLFSIIKVQTYNQKHLARILNAANNLPFLLTMLVVLSENQTASQIAIVKSVFHTKAIII